ncbi:MAG: ribonuclease HII [Holosporales bacterium]|jgi:ribonuclease HII|nr:ribonuclease HII [Holosporales bacterium]
MLSFGHGDTLEALYGSIVAGVDEVGRGPLAGPVVACAVAVLDKLAFVNEFSNVNDSKLLTKKRREQLYEMFCKCSYVKFAIGSASPEEIDEVNIRNATFLAMTRALDGLQALLHWNNMRISSYIVDGNAIPTDLLPGVSLIKGDSKSYRIAAASIVAKVCRDRYMEELSNNFPEYGWEHNAGYGTAKHLEAIKTCGVTPHHRKTFAGVL